VTLETLVDQLLEIRSNYKKTDKIDRAECDAIKNQANEFITLYGGRLSLDPKSTYIGKDLPCLLMGDNCDFMIGMIFCCSVVFIVLF
jgi:hypothetical protein